MSNARSVIEIDILDDKFKAFATLFDKFQATLDKMPKGWETAGKAVDKVDEKTTKTSAKIVKGQKEQNKHSNDGLKIVKETAKFTGQIAKDFASTAVSVAKWISLGAIGGGFGIGGLAASASDYRVRASGSNATTGELRAIQSNLKKYSDDPESLLTKIADMQADRAQTATLNVVGGSRNNTPFESMLNILKETQRVLSKHKDENGNVDLNVAESLGFTKIFNPSELRRIVNDKGELGADIAATEKNAQKLSNLDSENKALQEFWQNLIDAKNKIEIALIAPLSALAKPLGELTNVVVKAIADFLTSDKIKEAIEDFTKWIGSEDSKTAISNFFTALLKISDVIFALTKFLPDLSRPKDTPKGEKGPHDLTYKNGVIDQNNPENFIGGTTKFGRLLNSQNPEYQKAISGYDAKGLLAKLETMNKLPSGILGAVRQVESGGNNNAVSHAGAKGPFQLMDATAAQYGVKNSFDVAESGAAAAKLLKELTAHYAGNIKNALAAYNWGQGNEDAYLKTGRGAKGQPMPKETMDYVNKFTITVNNAAGGDLNVSANAMR